MSAERVCSVEGCERPAVRSISRARWDQAGLNLRLKDDRADRVYLCQEHYREFKKATKKLKRLEKWRLGMF